MSVYIVKIAKGETFCVLNYSQWIWWFGSRQWHVIPWKKTRKSINIVPFFGSRFPELITQICWCVNVLTPSSKNIFRFRVNPQSMTAKCESEEKRRRAPDGRLWFSCHRSVCGGGVDRRFRTGQKRRVDGYTGVFLKVSGGSGKLANCWMGKLGGHGKWTFVRNCGGCESHTTLTEVRPDIIGDYYSFDQIYSALLFA